MSLQLLNETEAAKILNVPRRAVRSLITPVRLSPKRLRYREDDIKKLITEKSEK